MIKNKYSRVFFASLLCLTATATLAHPPLNLTSEKRAIIQYYQDGEYEKDVSDVVKDADRYLQQRIDENKHLAKPQKLAIVFDIDDTLITHFKDHKKYDFGVSTKEIDENIRAANSPTIKPVLAFYNKAIQNHVSVFFVSLRPDHFRAVTYTQLKYAGYHQWAGLYLPKTKKQVDSSFIYKTAARKEIADKGYTIVLNIGDQESDLLGGYAEKTIKIPNPLYCITKNCA